MAKEEPVAAVEWLEVVRKLITKCPKRNFKNTSKAESEPS